MSPLLVIALASLIAFGPLALLAPVAEAQGAVGGTFFVAATPVAIGATVPCDSARYTFIASAPAEGKAYSARSGIAQACSTYFDLTTPAFTAAAPITVRVVMACDTPSPGAGVEGATASVRVIVSHGTKNLSGNLNFVGTPTCGTAAQVFQANVDLKGETFAAGDLLTVTVIPFYGTAGAGDPAKNLHFKTGGADASLITIPDLATPSAAAAPVLYQNVTTPELRVGREDAVALNETQVYNWTAAVPPRLSYEATVTSGQVSFEVLAAGASLANVTVTSSDAKSSDLGQSGNLTVRVTYSNFTGSFQLGLAPPPAGGGPANTGSASASPSGRPSQGGSVDDQETATSSGSVTDEPQEKDAPAPMLPALGVLLAAVLLWTRRKT